MTYFYPRNFDSDHPIVPGLSLPRRIKSYFGIKNCKSKLEKWLNDFNFIDLHFITKYFLIFFMIIGRVELLSLLLIVKKFLFKY